MTRSHSSSLMLKIIRSRRTPALFTRMSRLPYVSTAVLDHRLALIPVGDVAGVDDRVAARVPDLVDHRRRRGSSTRGSEVVHDDLDALPCELERVRAPEPLPRAGDDRDLAFHAFEHCSASIRVVADTFMDMASSRS